MNPQETIASGLAVGLFLLLVGVLLFSLKRPILARIGARNIPRRPLQSFFIMVGLTMSTTIFVASLSLGDTLNHSLRRNIIEAYGQIDQVVSPPQLQTLMNFLGNENEPTGEIGADESLEEFLEGLAEGDLNTLIQLFDEGLPGIPQERFLELDNSIADNQFIDGAEGVIFFPTVVRDISTGQGSPLSMIFAVDDTYATDFGLHDREGRLVLPSQLTPGVGDLFLSFSNSVSSVQQGVSSVAETAGWNEDFGLEATVGLAALLTLLFQPESTAISLNEIRIELPVLQALGIDTTFLEDLGIEDLTLASLGVDGETLEALGIDADVPIVIPSLNTLGADFLPSSNLFAEFNLNTLAQDMETGLQPLGLQMRRGQVYLSELGALQLNAEVGDLLEIFIGPIPVRYHVKAIVKEAGPFAPLAPVVIFEVAEAQKLLFMSERINAILISNAGDEISGMLHTDEVSQDLQLLSYEPKALDNIAATLTKQNNADLLSKHFESDPVVPAGDFDAENSVERFLARLVGAPDTTSQIQDVVAFANAEKASDLQTVQFELALGNSAVRSWLLELPLGMWDQELLQANFQKLDRFQVLPQLNKRFAVESVGIAGLAFGTLFWFPGSLSILAGLILIFLIFVLLAAERRHELGIARAVGMRRGHVVQTFVTEGVIYDLGAAFLGLGFGLLVAYGMVGIMSGLFAGASLRLSALDSFFNLQWSVAPASLVIAYCLGVLVTATVVVFASWQVSHMNIVAALRNLPEDIRSRANSLWWLVGKWLLLLALLTLGGLRFWPGLPEWFPIPVQIFESSLVAGAWGLAYVLWKYLQPLDSRRDRIIPTLAGLCLLAVWIWPWAGPQTENSAVEDPEQLLLSFVLATPFLLVGAILTVMGTAHLLAKAFVWIGSGMGAIAPAVHLAVAYPLDHKFRTGVAILLFSMVISTVVIMTQFIQVIQEIVVPKLEDTAGFDIVVTPGLLSVFDPLVDLRTESDIREDFPREDIEVLTSVTELGLQARQLSPANEDSLYLRAVGIDEGYVTQASQIYSFSKRAQGYGSDAEVWAALASKKDVAITTQYPLSHDYFYFDGEVLDSRNDPRRLSRPVSSHDELLPYISVVLSAESGVQRLEKEVQVIGVMSESQTLAGGQLQVNRSLLDELNGQPLIPAKHYVKVVPDVDSKIVAAAIEKSLLSSAQDATLFLEETGAIQTVTKSVLRLFRAFFTLGLIVGMTGLAVISTRAVLERRQQIGMLRAIGYRQWSVAAIFLFESSFISLSGILVGGATGLFLGQEIITQLFATNIEETISIPWLSVTAILSSTFGLALLSSLLPAWQASRVYPAEALRYE